MDGRARWRTARWLFSGLNSCLLLVFWKNSPIRWAQCSRINSSIFSRPSIVSPAACTPSFLQLFQRTPHVHRLSSLRPSRSSTVQTRKLGGQRDIFKCEREERQITESSASDYMELCLDPGKDVNYT
ncbi:hypothetical protein DENSPDRAFT_5617 [Dentipellis sp. KUC8613]|nr:hypothetical protein DENSPDRAFT_5617 [Dentipellis sp. KUC8613]